MDIINPSFLSYTFKQIKEKLNSNINQNDSNQSSPEKAELKKKRKEEDFIQLFPDSDELEEINPSLAKKIKEEEINSFSKTKSILLINDNKITHHKKRNPSKKRTYSSININYIEHPKNFKEEDTKEKTQESSSLNIKKTYTRNGISLYQPYIIHEEELSEDEDNCKENKNSISFNFNNFSKSIKYYYGYMPSYGYSSQMDFNKSKSQDFRNKGKVKSKLINSINNLSKNIEVYIFKTKKKINISINPNDTVKEVKSKIISILNKKKYNLPSSSPDNYDLRVLDEPEESPDLDLPPLRDYVLVSALMPQWLAFLKNSEMNEKSSISSSINNLSYSFSMENSFDSSSINQNNKNIAVNSFQMRLSKEGIVFEDKDKNTQKKCEVKVYYKNIKDIKNENNIKCVNIFLNENDTFKNILDYFFKKNLLLIKNENLYYFITHNSDENYENGYNLNITIQSLTPPYELDLCYKFFRDLPHTMNIYQLSLNKTKVKEKIKEVEEKNNLEQYCYQVRQFIGEPKLKDKFTENERRLIDTKVEEALKFFKDNPTASKKEYMERAKGVEFIFNTIVHKIQQSGGIPDLIPLLKIPRGAPSSGIIFANNEGNGDIE